MKALFPPFPHQLPFQLPPVLLKHIHRRRGVMHGSEKHGNVIMHIKRHGWNAQRRRSDHLQQPAMLGRKPHERSWWWLVRSLWQQNADEGCGRW